MDITGLAESMISLTTFRTQQFQQVPIILRDVTIPLEPSIANDSQEAEGILDIDYAASDVSPSRVPSPES